MPRIVAPTLAEHRDLRRTSLLGAGRDLLVSEGARAVTMAAVAQRAGLSRPAVYEYFSSSEALIGELLMEEMRRWSEQIGDTVAQARGPRDKVRAYIRSSLTMIADGRHAVATAAEGVELPAGIRDELMALHRSLALSLTQALEGLGVDDPARVAGLIQGVVTASGRRILTGAPVRAEIKAAERFALAGIDSAVVNGG